MDIKNHKIFLHLVVSKSFSSTAEKFNLSQPAITKIISTIEKNLTTNLFYKDIGNRKRKLQLTQAGEAFKEYSEKLVYENSLFEKKMNRLIDANFGKLRIGIPPLGATILTKSVAIFHEKFPNIELVFLEVGSDGIEEALINNDLDVGILLKPCPNKFDSIVICDYPIHVLAQKNSILKNKDQITLEELKGFNFLLFQNTFALNRIIYEACLSIGFKPKVSCKSSQWDFIIKMVEANIGIALLPKPYTLLQSEKLISIPLKSPEIRWKLEMSWKKNSHLNKATLFWLNIIKNEFKNILKTTH